MLTTAPSLRNSTPIPPIMNISTFRPVFRPLSASSYPVPIALRHNAPVKRSPIPATTSSFSSTARMMKRKKGNKGPGTDPRISRCSHSYILPTHGEYHSMAQTDDVLQPQSATTSAIRSPLALSTSHASAISDTGQYNAHGSSSCESAAELKSSISSGSTCLCAPRVSISV